MNYAVNDSEPIRMVHSLYLSLLTFVVLPMGSGFVVAASYNW
jgi:hypothetical protein